MFRFFACLFWACAVSGAYAGVLTGAPPVAYYAPDIEAYPQNFGIAQDGNALVYLASSDGVLVFDGARWQLVRLPNREIVRSLAFDGHDRVYVGGFDEIGYIQIDSRGQPVFHDLTPQAHALAPGVQLSDIWRVCVTDNGVYFRAVHYLFRYDPTSGAMRVWHNKGRFGPMGVASGEIIMQFRGDGLKRLHHGKWQSLPGATVGGLIQSMAKLPHDGLLLLGIDGPWRAYRNGKVFEYPMPAGLPSPARISSAQALADGTLVLAATDGYLYFVSADRKQLRRIRLEDGYLSGVVKDRLGGLLVVSDTGFYHVAWPSSWTTIGTQTGFSGPLRLSHWNGRWQVLTAIGVFESGQSTGENSNLQFHAVNWTLNEAWDLLPIDAHNALLAESYRVLLIHDGKARPITRNNLYPRILKQSRFDPELVYVGTEQGLASLRRHAGGWRMQLDDHSMGELFVGSLVEVAPGRLWLGSQRGGLHLVQISDDGKRIVSDKAMGPKQGLDYGDRLHGATVARLPNGDILVSTAAGVFRWQDGHFSRDSLGGLDRLRKKDEWLSLTATGKTLWAYSYDHIYRRDAGGRWHAEPIGHLLKGAIQSLYTDDNGNIAFVTTGGILCYSAIASQPSQSTPHVMLRSVRLTEANGQQRYLPLDQALLLPEGDQALTFAFALPDYAAQDRVRFQAALLGFENRTDAWYSSKQYTYAHLRPIKYRFVLRGRDGNSHVTSATPFSFEIIPPWYAHTWVEIVWLVLVACAILLLVLWYIRRRTHILQSDKLRLEDMVAERTRELESANHRLEAMVHVDGLTGISNRRRLDDYVKLSWEQAIERQRALSILAIDIDHFKLYNDKNGHLAGDQLLKRLAEMLSSCLRRGEDFVARYGGDEFLVVLPGAESNIAFDIAESMRNYVVEHGLGCTVSAGVASCIPQAGSPTSSLIKIADAALYEAKGKGRNRTVAAQ